MGCVEFKESAYFLSIEGNNYFISNGFVFFTAHPLIVSIFFLTFPQIVSTVTLKLFYTDTLRRTKFHFNFYVCTLSKFQTALFDQD